jgi:hypothetical protein
MLSLPADRGVRSRNHDVYRDFVEFVRTDVQSERSRVNRRMFNVFFWCFLIPALASAAFLLLIKFHVLPRRARGMLDWMALIFPISYSLYILSSEVLAQVPAVFRKGGTSNVLGQSLKDTEWRERVCESMVRHVQASPDEWRWVVASFRIDLQAIQYRTRYLTALAGAVFFLLMQGIDTLGEVTSDIPAAVWNKNPLMGWIESSSNDFSQLVGLALFLLLLYLSGNQTYHSLNRYLNCAELNLISQEKKSGR